MSPIIIVLIALAAAAVLAGVAFAVMGKGGELARFEADHPPLDLPADRPLSGSDVSRVLLPLALWGYHVRAVDDVLRRVVGALSERDARIDDLERRLAEAGQPVPPHVPPDADRGAAPGGPGPTTDTGPTAVLRTGAHPSDTGGPGTAHRTGARPRGASGGHASAADAASGSDAPESGRSGQRDGSPGSSDSSSGSSAPSDDADDSSGSGSAAGSQDTSGSRGASGSGSAAAYERESTAAASQRPGAR